MTNACIQICHSDKMDSNRSCFAVIPLFAEHRHRREFLVNSSISTISTPISTPMTSERDGVLWKRRDVFTGQWRPRWFRLQEDTGTLTYYLLRNQDARITAGTNHPVDLSENLDYETIPRGTVYLSGCVVSADIAMSRPDENLFVLSITAPCKNSQPYYLADTTEEARDEWVENLSRACNPGQTGIDSVRRKIQFENMCSQSLGPEETSFTDRPILEENYGLSQKEPSVFFFAIILLTPLILWKYSASSSNNEIVFILCALGAVRVVMELKLGSPLTCQSFTGPVTCRFSVSLRNVLRLLAKRKQNDDNPTVISILHIVTKAVGQALSEFRGMNSRRLSVPLLGMDTYYTREQIALSILDQDTLLTLDDVRSKSLDDISAMISKRQKKFDERDDMGICTALATLFIEMGNRKDYGSCLILYSSSAEESSSIEMAVAPRNGFNATVVIGDVSLACASRHVRSNSPRLPPIPTLTMSITMDCPACHAVTCRRFAKRIQHLVELSMEE